MSMNTATQRTTQTVDAAEIAKFEAMAAEWWDPNGKFKPLHMLNPCRLDYITSQIAAEFGRDLKTDKPFAGLRILDIGCGGGLLAEPMARLGADVVGADAAERNIPVARVHAEQSGLTIDYRHTTAEAMAAAGERFDAVLNMEVVEHVADPQGYLTACQELLKPGGLMICSTINRNPKSYLMAIVGAEHVMRWLPKGTHEWSKFITPDELYDLIRKAGLTPVDRKGFRVQPGRLELAAFGPRPVCELRDSLDQARLTAIRRRLPRGGAAFPGSPEALDARGRRRFSLIVSDRIGAMAAIAASRARRPAGLMETRLRRASSQSGRTWMCPAHSRRLSVFVIAPRVT